jgi:RNA polymerase sigma-70 factor (ECF subfamily)
MDALVEDLGEAPWTDDRAPDPESETLSVEVRTEVERALGRLPEEQRLAIVLVDMEGLSYEEAALTLHCAVGTIRSRLARGRARVRDEILAAGLLA